MCAFLHFRDVSVLPRNVHPNYPGAEHKCIFLGPLQTHGTSIPRRWGTGRRARIFTQRIPKPPRDPPLSCTPAGALAALVASPPGACSRCSPLRPASAPPLSPPSVAPEIRSCLGFRPAAHNQTEAARSLWAHSPARAQLSRPARSPSAEVTAASLGALPPLPPGAPPRPLRSALPAPPPSPLTSAFCQPVSLSLSPSLLPLDSSLAPEYKHLSGPGSAPSSLLPLPPSPPRPEGSGPDSGSLAAASPPLPQTRWTPPRKVSGGARALAPAPGFGPGPRPGRGTRGRRLAQGGAAGGASPWGGGARWQRWGWRLRPFARRALREGRRAAGGSGRWPLGAPRRFPPVPTEGGDPPGFGASGRGNRGRRGLPAPSVPLVLGGHAVVAARSMGAYCTPFPHPVLSFLLSFRLLLLCRPYPLTTKLLCWLWNFAKNAPPGDG